jgi:uncharacterized protein GlcG (DUF336 family)
MLTIKRLSLTDAKTIADACEAKAREVGTPKDIAIVDESGHLIEFRRMDGAKFSSVEIAINKAFTSAGGGRATKDYKEIAGPGGAAFGLHTQFQGRFTILGGGVPVVVDGQIVGAVGISSGAAAEDHLVAEAGIAAFLALKA